MFNLIMACFGVAGVLLCSGCTVYMEQETPAGFVPPHVQPVAQPTTEQGIREVYSAKLTSEGEQYLRTGSRTLEDFRSAYRAAGKPRIAIYFNRSLSDDVSGWKGQERLVDNFHAKAQTRHSSGSSQKDFLAVGGETLEYQTATRDPQRRGVSDSWDWSLEEGFIEPFMTAGSIMVDRATILRLTGADKQNADLSPRTVEISALKNYADIYVELLVSRQQNFGEFAVKAIAKDIQTGAILASAMVKEGERSASTEYIATANGFQPAGVGPHAWGGSLADKIMVSLISNWSR